MSLNVENLSRLIAHLETVPEERFNMLSWFTRRGEAIDSTDFGDCGTAACIGGWIDVIRHKYDCCGEVWLGLNYQEGMRLFIPSGLGEQKYPIDRALRTLRHLRSEYLRTGQVVIDWDAPDERAPWSAPVVAEQVLPDTLTSLLRAPAVEVAP